MGGDCNKLDKERKTPANEKEQEQKEEKSKLKTDLRKLRNAVILTAGILTAAATFARCGSTDDNGSTDAHTEGEMGEVEDGPDAEEAGDVEEEEIEVPPCENDEKTRANVKVPSGWGYVEDDNEKVCSSESGCLMGINEGEELVMKNADGQKERRVVESISEEALVARNAEDEDKVLEVGIGGGIDTDGEQERFVSVSLAGTCNSGTCENGVSTDVDNATGAMTLEVKIGEDTGRVVLSDGETKTVEVGENSVTVTLVKATESQAYVIYGISGSTVEGTELGTPVDQGSEVYVESITLKNRASSDNAAVECRTLYASIAVLDANLGVDEPFTYEYKEDGLIELGDKKYKVEKIFAETVTKEDGTVWPDPNLSSVVFTDVDSGEEIVLYAGDEIKFEDGSTINLENVYAG